MSEIKRVECYEYNGIVVKTIDEARCLKSMNEIKKNVTRFIDSFFYLNMSDGDIVQEILERRTELIGILKGDLDE